MSQRENSARCLTSEAWKGRWESCRVTFTSRRGHWGRKDRGDLGEVLSVCWCVQDYPGEGHAGSRGRAAEPPPGGVRSGEGHAVVPRKQCPGDKVVPLQEWPNRAAGYSQPPTLGQAEGACGLGSLHHKEMFGEEVCFQTRSTMARGGHEAGEGRGPGRCTGPSMQPCGRERDEEAGDVTTSRAEGARLRHSGRMGDGHQVPGWQGCKGEPLSFPTMEGILFTKCR